MTNKSDFNKTLFVPKLWKNYAVSNHINNYSVVRPHWHDFYQLELVIAPGKTTIDADTHTINTAFISLLSPLHTHSYQFSEPRFEVYVVNFELDYLESQLLISLLSNTSSYFYKNLSEQELSFYKNIFSEIIQINGRHFYDKTKLYCMQAIEFLISYLIYHSSETSNNTLHPLALYTTNSHVYNAIGYIHMHFRDHLQLSDVASFVHLSSQYFSKLFHDTMQCSFEKYLINLRIDAACNMLLKTSDSVEMISYNCGFNTIHHFCKAFKKYVNMTPTQYRKSSTHLPD